jgi:hypothetical protein
VNEAPAASEWPGSCRLRATKDTPVVTALGATFPCRPADRLCCATLLQHQADQRPQPGVYPNKSYNNMYTAAMLYSPTPARRQPPRRRCQQHSACTPDLRPGADELSCISACESGPHTLLADDNLPCFLSAPALTLLSSIGSPFLFPPRAGTVAPAMERLQVIVRCGRLPRLRCRPKGSRVLALSVARPQFFKLGLGRATSTTTVCKAHP